MESELFFLLMAMALILMSGAIATFFATATDFVCHEFWPYFRGIEQSRSIIVGLSGNRFPARAEIRDAVEWARQHQLAYLGTYSLAFVNPPLPLENHSVHPLPPKIFLDLGV